jgi:hypothetical protein
MKLRAEGKPLREIRTYIDQTYSRPGVGTKTPFPPD